MRSDPNNPNNVVGNFEDKYASQNPIARHLVGAFLDAVTELYVLAHPRGKTVLEVGCGEGTLATWLMRNAPTPARYLATDVPVPGVGDNSDRWVGTLIVGSLFERARRQMHAYA